MLRDAGDRPEPERDERARGGEENPVQPGDERPLLRARERPRSAAAPSGLDGVDVLDHQSVFPMSPIAGAFVLKCCSNTLSAAGAAAVPPWPPFSMTAQTAIDGLSAGA